MRWATVRVGQALERKQEGLSSFGGPVQDPPSGRMPRFLEDNLLHRHLFFGRLAHVEQV